MRQFYFDSDGDDFDDDDIEMEMEMMEVDGQFMLIPDGAFMVQPDNPLAIQLELKKTLLFAALTMLEKSWTWRFKSAKKKQELLEETYLMLEELVHLEFEENRKE